MNKDWIITARHVVMEDGLKREDLVITFPNNINSYKIDVFAVHKEIDIAVLTLENSPCEFPLFPGYENLNSAKNLICLGYTPSQGEILNAAAVFKYDQSERERSTTEEILEFSHSEYEGGSSGGPIFGNGGVVLGILINLIETDSQNNKIVRATSIHNLVNEIEMTLHAKNVTLL